MTHKSLTVDDFEGQYALLWLNCTLYISETVWGRTKVLIEQSHKLFYMNENHLLVFWYLCTVGPP